MHANQSRGRRYPEALHKYRSEYARDRDRIVHARAFRRLEAKTQVFTMRFSDHFRNRLTHTLEVSQIARTVATALGLNSELVEALALVHDIGHPPFGHARDYAGKEAEWPELAEYSLDLRPPLEAQLIDWVDEIAYNTADLDDAREAELLDLKVLRRDVPIFGEAYERVNAKYPTVIEKLKFNDALKGVLDQLVTDLIETTSARVR